MMARMAGKKTKKKKPDEGTLIAKNRKAFFHFEIVEQVEAGIVLLGTEVKSLRDGKITIGDGHVMIRGSELFLVNVHISPYRMGTTENHEPLRPRKLLLKRREIHSISRRVAEKGLSVVPLAVYFNAKGVCKVKLGVGRGKKLHDKRRSIAERDSKRRIERQQHD